MHIDFSVNVFYFLFFLSVSLEGMSQYRGQELSCIMPGLCQDLRIVFCYVVFGLVRIKNTWSKEIYVIYYYWFSHVW